MDCHVRFGSKADIRARPINVRFTPKSGHRRRQKQFCYALTTSLNDSFYRARAWGARLLRQSRPCVLGAGTVSGRGPLQVVSACYPSATQPIYGVAPNARSLHEIAITRVFEVRN